MIAGAWQGILDGSNPGTYNMARDEALARELGEGRSPVPTVRLYGWQPWAISLGRHQAVADIDADRCAEKGIDIVRRPTGGRAILHAEELTYCVVMPAGRRGILDVYNDISRALVRGLKLFGVDVALQKSQPDFRAEYRKTASIPCFASSARYEIEWNGRKLVGSAQRRLSGTARDVVLQHGSILCGPAHQQLPEFLALRDEQALEEVRSLLQSHTVDLSEITGADVDRTVLAGCLWRGFEEEWGVKLKATEPATCRMPSNYA